MVGTPGSHPWFVGDSFPIPQVNWSAYVLTGANLQWQQDPAYSTGLTNYVPMHGNLTNTFSVPNSVQTTLSYWVKIQHKTEYDAEQAGHSVAVPHYVDGDGVFTLHSQNARGQLIRFGYSGNSSIQPGQFSTSAQSIYPPVEIIRSQGEVEGAISIIQADVAHQPGPPIWAPVYVGNQIHLSGGSITVQGEDICGLIPLGLPPISLAPGATISGVAALTGNPGVPQVGPQALDLAGYVERLQTGGQLMPEPEVVSGAAQGMPDLPVLLVAKPLGGLLTLTNVTGYGLLLVDGSLRIHPPFHWEGMIIVSGQMTIESGVSPVLVRGAVLADVLTILNRDVTISLDSCHISRTLPVMPITVLNWRQML